MNQCTATSKRTGERCKARAVTGRSVCYHHGGKTPRGTALPQTTHGRYSQDLPTQLADRYQAAQADPDLLSLRDEIALMSTRIGELLSTITAGQRTDEAQATWEAISLLIDQRRKLAEAERKRLVDMQQMITAEQAAVLVATLTDAVRRHVDDPAVLSAIAADVDRILTRPSA